jgi:lipid A 3-O-deacylase
MTQIEKLAVKPMPATQNSSRFLVCQWCCNMRFGVTFFCMLALLWVTPCRAASGINTILKDTSVIGTLATWAFALLDGAPLLDSVDNGWRAHLQNGEDLELSSYTVGLIHGENRLLQGSGQAPLLSYSPHYSASYWTAESRSQGSHTAWDVAAVPMLHWRLLTMRQIALTADVGIGVAYLSKSNIGNRIKGSNFQFSDHVGLGVEHLASKLRAGIGYRHISNANLTNQNNGVDFLGGTLEVPLSILGF